MVGTKGRSGGARPNTGPKRKYARIIKVPVHAYIPVSEPLPLTPESDLTICLAVSDERRGMVIDGIWYGAKEAQAIGRFVAEHHAWLSNSGS